MQDRGDGRDTLARGQSLLVMAWDSTYRGGRPLVASPGSYAKPLVVPGGRRFVFLRSPRSGHLAVYGPTAVRPTSGRGSRSQHGAIRGGRDWIFAGLQPTFADPAEYQALVRFPLDDPSRREAVALHGIVNEDNFQVAADGRLAGGCFPGPTWDGSTSVQAKAEEVAENGCWASLAPLRRRCSVFSTTATDE